MSLTEVAEAPKLLDKLVRKRRFEKQQMGSPPKINLGAIVCPLTPRELPLAIEKLALWGEKIPPGLAQPEHKSAERPRLLFSFNCGPNRDLSEPLRDAFDRQSALVDSFASMEVRFCDLPPEKDIYLRTLPKILPEFGTKAGPNWMWFETLKAVRSEAKFVFLMETDCTPIVPNWLRRIESACRQNQDAWIIGSHYCGVSPLHWSIARHINGNALYHVGDPAFWKFLEELFWPWLHKRIKEKDPQLAYDCAWEVFLNRQEMERAGHPDWLVARKLLHRFRLSNFIVNIAGNAEQNGYYYWTRSSVLENYPRAAIVHGPIVNSDNFVRSGVALGKLVLDRTVTATGRGLTYKGNVDKTRVRFRRSFWLPTQSLDSKCRVQLRFVLQCLPKTGIEIELKDANGTVVGAGKFEGREINPAKVRLFDCELLESHAFLTLTMKFHAQENGDTEQELEISQTLLEVKRDGVALGKVKRIFD